MRNLSLKQTTSNVILKQMIKQSMGIVLSGAAWNIDWGGPKPGTYVTRGSNSFSSIASCDRGTWLQGSAPVVVAVLSALGVMCVHVK